MIRFVCIFLLASLTAAGAACREAKEALVELTAVPDRIEIGTLYHGTDVRVAADVPLCDHAVITIVGPDREIVLNRKGRLAVIWMTVAHVTVKNAPQVYVLAASGSINAICPPEERRRLGLGLESLRGSIEFESDEGLTGREFDEFVKLKKHDGSYAVSARVVLGPENGDRRTLSAVMPVAASTPPGVYPVRLYCFTADSLVAQASVPITIEKVGLPRFTTALAFQHAAAYGTLAVLIAMLAGITMGVIFSSRPGRGH
jgi:uncharacterized protein (TIGR02186 family)